MTYPRTLPGEHLTCDDRQRNIGAVLMDLAHFGLVSREPTDKVVEKAHEILGEWLDKMLQVEGDATWRDALMRLTCDYDMCSYTHRQIWALIRNLTASGWTVTLTANEERRGPGEDIERVDAYLCYVKNPGWGIEYAPPARAGRTPWEALKQAVDEIVTPAESGEERIGL